MNSRRTLIAVSAFLIAAAPLSMPAISSTFNFIRAEMKLVQDGHAGHNDMHKADTQTATIEITSKGFSPASLKLKAGVPAKVTFLRKTDETCAKEISIKDYKINRKLPLNKPVTVSFTPRKGEFLFVCGMKMLEGKVVVE